MAAVKKGKTMSKSSKPLDIPLRGSKKSFVGIGQNILSDEENSVALVIGKTVIYSKSVKKEIEIDTIYSLSPSPNSNSFTSMSSLQSLPLEEEVSACTDACHVEACKRLH